LSNKNKDNVPIAILVPLSGLPPKAEPGEAIMEPALPVQVHPRLFAVMCWKGERFS